MAASAEEDSSSVLDAMLAESGSFSSPTDLEMWLGRLESTILSVQRQSPPVAPDEAAAFTRRLATAQDYATFARQQLLAYTKQVESEQGEAHPLGETQSHTEQGAAKPAAPAEIAATLARHSSASLARHSSASERSRRREIEHSTKLLEADSAQVGDQLQAAQTEIELLKTQVAELMLGSKRQDVELLKTKVATLAGGQLRSVDSELPPKPRSLSDEEKAALLRSLAKIPIEATDDVAAIVQEFCSDEEVDLAALPVAALLRIKDTLDALAKPSTGRTPSILAFTPRARAEEPAAQPSHAKTFRRSREPSGGFRPNPAAVSFAPLPASGASPSRRARPEDLSHTSSTRGNAAKVRATATPTFTQAAETQPSQPQHTVHSSDEMSRTSTFADMLKGLSEGGAEQFLADQAATRPVTYSFVGVPGFSMDRTSTDEMTEADRTWTDALEMEDADMSRTTTVQMSDMSRTTTVQMQSATEEDRARRLDRFVAEVQQTLSVLATSGADTKQAFRAVQNITKLVRNGQGQFVAARQNAVAEVGGASLLHTLSVYAAVPGRLTLTLIALLHLCYGNATVCQGVCGAGGVELILGTMASHLREVRLQQEALGLSTQFAQHGGVAARAALVGANVLQAIATAMRTHSRDSLIFRYGCTTLNALLRDPSVALHTANQVWHLGIVQLVQTALPQHVGKRDFEKLRSSAEQLAELMSQAASLVAQAQPF